jgi:3-oxoacyl-(acyl-carrier-protein) synthase
VINESKLAVVGYSCEFAGSSNPTELWELLLARRSVFGEIPEDRWSKQNFYSADRYERNKSVSKWLASIDLAQARARSTTQMSSTQQAQIDPQQWLLSDHVRLAIESTGLDKEFFAEYVVSVSVGAMAVDNILNQVSTDKVIGPETTLGNYQALIANRLSTEFGFTGESKTINTACSASFMALVDAKRQLIANDAEFAFVAAANLSLNPLKYLSFSKAGMLSPSGRCVPFSIEADGYVPGDGVAVILLTTLERAQLLKLPIHAVIDSVVGNHNGSRAPSITAPNVDAQVELLRDALSKSNTAAESISYIEAHGTGTSLGDPIEIDALSRVFSDCRVGSIKGVIGHTEAAAGLAGLIKVVLMLKHKVVPSNFWIKTLNPLIAERKGTLHFPTDNEVWEGKNGILRASVSSFGFGGANGHVLLSTPPEVQDSSSEPRFDDGYYLGGNLPNGGLSYVQATTTSHRLIEWSKSLAKPSRRIYSCLNGQFEKLAVDSAFNIVNSIDYISHAQMFNALNRPFVIHEDGSSADVHFANLRSDLVTGSIYIGSKSNVWRCSAALLEEMSLIPAQLKRLAADWLSTMELLEHHQFTYRMLLTRWRRLGADRLTGCANIFASLELYDKWGLGSVHLPSSLKFVYLFIKHGVVEPSHVLQIIDQPQSLLKCLATGLAKMAINQHHAPDEIFLSLASYSGEYLDIDFDRVDSRQSWPKNNMVELFIVHAWRTGFDICWDQLPSRYLSSLYIETV